MEGFEIKMAYPEQFEQIAEAVYRDVFGAEKPKQQDRIDFACIVYHEGKPVGYSTCYEHNSEVLYMQFGGAFPEFKNTRYVYFGYDLLIRKLLERYSFLLTRVENDNISMLKMAFKCGWRIVGTFLASDKKLLVELMNSKTSTISDRL